MSQTRMCLTIVFCVRSTRFERRKTKVWRYEDFCLSRAREHLVEFEPKLMHKES